MKGLTGVTAGLGEPSGLGEAIGLGELIGLGEATGLAGRLAGVAPAGDRTGDGDTAPSGDRVGDPTTTGDPGGVTGGRSRSWQPAPRIPRQPRISAVSHRYVRLAEPRGGSSGLE